MSSFFKKIILRHQNPGPIQPRIPSMFENYTVSFTAKSDDTENSMPDAREESLKPVGAINIRESGQIAGKEEEAAYRETPARKFRDGKRPVNNEKEGGSFQSKEILTERRPVGETGSIAHKPIEFPAATDPPEKAKPKAVHSSTKLHRHKEKQKDQQDLQQNIRQRDPFVTPDRETKTGYPEKAGEIEKRIDSDENTIKPNRSLVNSEFPGYKEDRQRINFAGQMRAGLRQDKEQEPVEKIVNVNIGRIEIRAIKQHRPVRPQPDKPKSNNSSLNDYLKGRDQ